jgi:hypothetical protein
LPLLQIRCHGLQKLHSVRDHLTEDFFSVQITYIGTICILPDIVNKIRVLGYEHLSLIVQFQKPINTLILMNDDFKLLRKLLHLSTAKTK